MARSKVEDTATLEAWVWARLEALVKVRLTDMGLGEREHGHEIRPAAKAYYLGLIKEELENSDDVRIYDCIDSLEGITMGFVAGYEACLKARA